MESDRRGGPRDLAERPLPPDGADPRDGPSGRGFADSTNGRDKIASPLGRLPRPNGTPIQNGPVQTMLAQADTYASAHPQNYRDMVDSYRQILSKARGTPQEREVNQRLAGVVERHQAALRKTIRDYEQKMNEKLRARKPQEAYDLWKDFPQTLRTLESDQEIGEILQRSLPPDFVPR
jgi:hypothetical protein